MDYGDGKEPRELFHVNDRDTFQPLSLDYFYSDWGIYTITVTARNNISSVSQRILIQVRKRFFIYIFFRGKVRVERWRKR